MAQGFRILRKLDDAKSLLAAWRETREEADRLVLELANHWPAEYVIEEIPKQSSLDYKAC